MTITDYYKILSIPANASMEEIKKAYRNKARQYHPDINPSPDAKDLFISATEAYEFLISNHNKLASDDQAYHQATEDWRKYRQDRSRHRATVYAKTSYKAFKNSNFYKSTRIFDFTTLIICFATSIMILGFTVYGYIFRLKNPIPGTEKPSVLVFILILGLGLSFLAGSYIYFKAYQGNNKKHAKKL